MRSIAKLRTKCGKVFFGFCPSYQKKIARGPLVFSTGMTGYVESLTDPSYKGQILLFTYPLIGNYGVPAPSFWESENIHVGGLIVSSPCQKPSHYKAKKTLLEWLQEQKVPLLWGVDTRSLAKLLRDKGSLLAAFGKEEDDDELKKPIQDPTLSCLLGEVSIKKPYEIGSGKKKVVAVDCGIKKNIVRSFVERGVCLKVVPYDYDYTKETADGIFLSNGPGDPRLSKKTIAILRKELEKDRPVFGVCLGAQLLALAAKGTTSRLPCGHRGHNQPCFDEERGKAVLTSQNHGWVIDKDTLPKDWRVHFTNLNDGSVEGIKHKKKPHFGVQFHPESSPGPNDTKYLFNEFIKLL